MLAATGLSASRIYQLERAGLFPKRISLGDNTTGWREIEVRRWLVGRIEHGATRLTGALAPQSKPAKGSRRAPAAKVGG